MFSPRYLSLYTVHHDFYDTTKQRILYSARSINQVMVETFEEHLSDMVRWHHKVRLSNGVLSDSITVKTYAQDDFT